MDSGSSKKGGSVDVLADLRGVVRIARAASIGVSGNASRIERAEAAIAAVAELIEADKVFDEEREGFNALYANIEELDRYEDAEARRAAALVRVGGAK